jgi:hypothetical protein
MSSHTGNTIIRGAGPDDAGFRFMSSYRSELGGLTALLGLLSCLGTAFGIGEGQCTIYCDNQGAITNVFTPQLDAGIYPLLAPDYDLLGIARDLMKHILFTIMPEYVKFHYTGNNRQLKHLLNEEADDLANSYRENPHPLFSPSAQPTFHPKQVATIQSNDTTITSKLSITIYSNIYSPLIKDTICKNAGLTSAQFDRIDWNAHEIAYKTLSRYKKISVSKHLHNLWHTASRAHRISADNSAACHLCHHPMETSAHVLTCPATSATLFRLQAFTTFRESLAHLELPESFYTTCQHGIDYFTTSLQTGAATKPRPPTANSIHPMHWLLSQAYNDQSNIGWHNFLRGRLSPHWGTALTFHATNNPTTHYTSQHMTKAIIISLWEYSLNVWEFRNGELHGHSAAEQKLRTLVSLQLRVRQQFEAYTLDPSIVHASDRFLFSRTPVNRRITHNVDTLTCWLSSVEIARQRQSSYIQHLQWSSARFFAPFFLARRTHTDGPQTG